jgi:prepilin-type processing-associated H-X9-DG protein
MRRHHQRLSGKRYQYQGGSSAHLCAKVVEGMGGMLKPSSGNEVWDQETNMLAAVRSNNYPNQVGDHGAGGSNWLFCDGHVEWVKVNNYRLFWTIARGSE